jgi:hypothetical protein
VCCGSSYVFRSLRCPPISSLPLSPTRAFATRASQIVFIRRSAGVKRMSNGGARLENQDSLYPALLDWVKHHPLRTHLRTPLSIVQRCFVWLAGCIGVRLLRRPLCIVSPPSVVAGKGTRALCTLDDWVPCPLSLVAGPCVYSLAPCLWASFLAHRPLLICLPLLFPVGGAVGPSVSASVVEPGNHTMHDQLLLAQRACLIYGPHGCGAGVLCMLG